MEELKLGFIGAGNMASAILTGVLRQKMLQPDSIWLSNRHAEKLEHFAVRGVHTTTNNLEVAKAVDIVVLAVKPQMFDEVLTELSGALADKCVVSIAAGISARYLRERLPGAQVVRVMPNTPLMVGMGATAVARAADVSEEHFRAVLDLFRAAGTVELIEESQMDDIINVNGSTPAFFFRMVDSLTRRAVGAGIDSGVALRLAAQTMEGSARLLLESGKNPEELIRQVCSPGGTTLAALSAFDEMGFDALLREATDRCTQRSRELGR